jgi:ketosteroid isomerase-like protein
MMAGVADVNSRALAEDYLNALGRADLDALLALFTAGAVVHSPLYGPMPAGDFYPALLADTAGSQLALRGVMDGAAVDGTPLVSVWFTFGWRLADGAQISFDVVDVLELTGDGQIAALRIIYDTSAARPVFEAQTGRRSWHSGLPTDT